ncbi:MAG: hypothetical protein KBD63_04545 [Bacteriovoracaceae bacterium]|nr:hypothetical protein [Bacteriovoracaceae bacterium]
MIIKNRSSPKLIFLGILTFALILNACNSKKRSGGDSSQDEFTIEGNVTFFLNLLIPSAYADDGNPHALCTTSCSDVNACAKLYYYDSNNDRVFLCSGDFIDSHYSIHFSTRPLELATNPITNIVIVHPSQSRVLSTVVPLLEGNQITRNINMNDTVSAVAYTSLFLNERSNNINWASLPLANIQTITSNIQTNYSSNELLSMQYELGLLDEFAEGNAILTPTMYVSTLASLLTQDNPLIEKSFRNLVSYGLSYSSSNGGISAIKAVVQKPTFASLLLSNSSLLNDLVSVSESLATQRNSFSSISNLIGTYALSSCEDLFGVVYIKSRIVFFLGTGTLYADIYGDASCTMQIDSVEKNFYYSVGATVPDAAGIGLNGKEINITYISTRLTFQDATSVASNNTSSLCGFNDWEVDVTKDITGLTCDNFIIPNVGELEYDIYYLDTTANPHTLQFGNPLRALNNYPTLGSRPTTVSSILLEKI